jgi:hypothetical protein
MTEVPTRTRANALITARKYEPMGYDEPAQGPVLTRIHVEESFSGDIAGEGGFRANLGENAQVHLDYWFE